eukprot:1808615-Alexandrium_andersonii.AAC.1
MIQLESTLAPTSNLKFTIAQQPQAVLNDTSPLPTGIVSAGSFWLRMNTPWPKLDSVRPPASGRLDSFAS